MSSQVTLIMPYNTCRSHAYFYNPALPTIIDSTEVKGVRFAGNADVEFYEANAYEVLEHGAPIGRQGVTGQVSGVLDGPAKIFVHPDHERYARSLGLTLRHPVMHTEFLDIDYLRSQGVNITLKHGIPTHVLDTLPNFLFDVYTFFGVAELCQVFTGQCKQDVRELVREKAIVQNKRLLTRDGRNDSYLIDYCAMPWGIDCEGILYAAQLRFIDICGLHGVASYRDLLINLGFAQDALDDKDLMHTEKLIERMHTTYFTHPEEYDRYALNDLHIYKLLESHANLFEEIYTQLGLQDFYVPPALTIGKTIAQLFEAVVLRACGLGGDRGPLEEDNAADKPPLVLQTKQDILRALCYYGSAPYLRQKVDSTAAYLAKIFGGRCVTNRPSLVALLEGVIDLDLSGCYGQGLRAQRYPLGRPVIMHYPADSRINNFPTLAQFLKDRKYFTSKRQLVPGLWSAVITMAPDATLRYPQTFFPSWFQENARKNTTILPPEGVFDWQLPVLEMATDSGNTKIFQHRIDHGTLTEDGLEWILHACGNQQRNELLNKLYVTAAAYHKASDRVDSVDELRRLYAKHHGRNTWKETTVDDLTTITETGQEFYKWTDLDMGKVVVNDLLALRKLYPKGTSHDILYKLCVNGLFGILVSPFFSVGNVIVGQNITARGRAACWYMEASLNGAQSITDGVQTNPQTVTYPRDPKRRITPLDVFQLRYERNLHRNKQIRLAPLANYDRIESDFTDGRKALRCYRDNQEPDVFEGDALKGFINETMMIHMQNLWSEKITVLHDPTSTHLIVANAGSESPPARYTTDTPRIGQYEFEMKDLFERAVFHSAANHQFRTGDEAITRMRSYKRKASYYAYHLIGEDLVYSPLYDNRLPSDVFFEQLFRHPHAVERGLVYVVKKLTKPDQWRVRYRSFFQFNGLDPGDSHLTCGLFKEFSLSQFMMQTAEQYLALEREYTKSKERYGQYVECYFVNDDPLWTLDYARMIEEVQRAIDKGEHSLLQAFDRPGVNRMHPAFPAFQAMRTHLEHIQCGYVVDEPEVYQDDQQDEVFTTV